MLRSLVAAYPTQAVVTTMYNRYVLWHLYSACAPKTVWMHLNCERIRRHIGKDLIEPMAFGAT